MQTFSNIFNGESGLSVRGKLNNALTSIISGSEGINAIWTKINSVVQMVNAMDGGVGGLVKDTSYDPKDLDQYKNCILISLVNGTFTNLKDSDGLPITISDENAITILYRAAGASYWEYDSQTISPTLDGKISSDQTKMVGAGKGYITNNGDPFAPMSLFSQIKNDNNVNESLLDILIELGKGYKGIVLHHTLDSLGNPGVYLVKTTPSDTSITYILEVLIDPFQHQVSQVLLGNVDNPNESYLAHHDSLHPRRWCRYAPFTLSSGNGIPGDWSKWELVDFFDLKDTNDSELDIADDYGNVLARFSGGHIKTKNFDSADIKSNIEVEDNDYSDLDISDDKGNIILRLKDGHIQTKNFDSRIG